MGHRLSPVGAQRQPLPTRTTVFTAVAVLPRPLWLQLSSVGWPDNWFSHLRPANYLEPGRNICHRPGPAIVELRRALHLLSNEIGGGATSIAGIEDTPAYLVLACLDSGLTAAPNSPCGKRSAALRSALNLIDSTPLQEINVTDLARKTGTSRRTLEHAFRDNFELSPAAYIKVMRLRAFNRELLHTDRLNESVGELCRQHGFHHQGQLAADYLAMFGERPLATLQR